MEENIGAAICRFQSVWQRPTRKAVVGFDAAIDKIMEVVDKRTGWDTYQRIPTITDYASRIQRAAGLSTNVEIVPKVVKTGGCAVNMASALLNLGLSVSFAGTVGENNVHPLFAEFAERCTRMISMGEPSYAQALEFEDGKIIMAELAPMQELTWEKMIGRFPVAHQVQVYAEADVIAMVNWTETPHMNQIWHNLLEYVFPELPPSRERLIFFDLADPEKRHDQELYAGLMLIRRFGLYGKVVLGLNRKEATAVARALGIRCTTPLAEASLGEITKAIASALDIHGVVVHPVSKAGLAMEGEYVEVQGPFTPNPRLVTGAGDNFNAGFVYGLALGLEPQDALILGVGTSGFYVRNMGSPTAQELMDFLKAWGSAEGCSSLSSLG
mgnify:FL=1